MLTLANAPDRLDEAPNGQTLLSVWQQWRGDRLLPTRANALPEDLRSVMSAISILEIEARERIMIRMLASDIETFAGRTRKGENYADLARPEDREERIERHQRLVNTPCGAISTLTVMPEAGRTTTFTSLYLPLAADSRSKPAFLYAAVDIRSDKSWEQLPMHVSTPLADVFDYIDIGYGLPA